MSNNKSLWIITGAASGIGAAMVRTLTTRDNNDGYNVLALDVDETAGAALARETGATFRRCDVSKYEDWQDLTEFLQASETELGTPSRIHLNAGVQIAPPDAPMSAFSFDAMTMARYRRMMGVNVDGVVFGLHTLLPLLQPGASIVVTASLAGITPYAIDPLYAMSKHAVAGLVRSLGPTLKKRDIRINAICPGGIDTPLVPLEQKNAGGVDASFFMTPEHIAEEVITLIEQPQTGKTWAKVSEAKPAFIIRAPGDKDKKPGK